MASNPYSRDSSRTWSTRSCVEQFGIYRETPVKPYNYYKNNSRFIRTGVVAVMLAVVILLVILMISDISKTNGAHRSREKDAFLRLLSASKENNNKTPSPKPTPSTSTPNITTTSSTTTTTTQSSPSSTKPAQDIHHSNHRPTNDHPVNHVDFHDDDDTNYDWSEHNPSDLADRKLHELTRLRPPNRRYDDAEQDIHIHIPTGYVTPSRDLRPPDQGHRVFRTPDGTEHHEISYSEPKPVNRDIPLHWDGGHKSKNTVYAPNAVYHGERVPSKQQRPHPYERPIVVLDDPAKGYGQKLPAGYPGQPVPVMTGYKGQPVPTVTGYRGQPVPSVKGYNSQPVPALTRYHGQPVHYVKGYHGQSVPAVTGHHGQSVPPVKGYNSQSVPPVKGYNGQSVPAVTGYNGQSLPPGKGYNSQSVPAVTGYNGQPVPAATGHRGSVKYKQQVPGKTDYRVFNHHAHNLSDVQQKTASASDAYPQYWRPYLDDLSHGSSKQETRIVNRNPGGLVSPSPKPNRKLKAKKNATRLGAASNKFPQLLNYHYPKDAKNIGDIIRYLNRFEPPQKEDSTPLFDSNLGKIMKLKGVYVTHINDDADVETTSNGHAYNADPFQAYKPDNMADINYLVPNEYRLPTRANQNLFKNTIRHLDEQKRNEQGGRGKYFPRPPIEYAGDAATSHQSYNSPVEAYTTAIYHPWSTNAPKVKATTVKPSPMSVMLDVYPMDAVEVAPSKGVKRKPAKTLKLNLDKVAAASGKKQQMVLHLNLYPRKKQNVISRADLAEPDSASRFNVKFNSDTHEIVPAKRYYNEDYEGEIRRSDDDYYDDEEDDDYEQRGERINATLDSTEFRKTGDPNATVEREYEREGEEVDLRINIEETDYPSGGDFLFDEVTTSPIEGGVSVENVSEKPPEQGKTTESGDSLVTVFPTKSLDRLDSLLGDKSRYVVRISGRENGLDFDRANVLSALQSEVENSGVDGNNTS